MGDVLSHRYEFSKLEEIREAYSSAFPSGNHSQAIDRALSDKAIDALQIVRNIIVHKNGVADSEYVTRAKSILGALAPREGDRLALNGPLVNDLVKPVLNASVRLLKAVDSWLVNH